MKKLFLLPLAILISTSIVGMPVYSAQKVEVKTTTYTLIKDVNKTLKFDYVPGTVAVGSSKIVDFKVFRAKKEIHLIPRSKGVTNLTIRDTNGELREEVLINVTESDLSGVANDMQDLLKGIEGIEIKIVGNKILIDGDILLPSDFNRIAAVVNESDSKEVGVIARLSPVAKKIIAEKMEEDLIKSLGGENQVTVGVRALNDQFLIEGMVPSEALKQRATKISESYVPDIFSEYGEREKILKRIKPPSVVNLLAVNPPAEPEPTPPPPPPPPRVVKLTTYFVELSKDYKKNFRFQWAPGSTDGSRVDFSVTPESAGIVSSVVGSITNLIPRLQKAKEMGQARILQTHTLLISEKEEGKIENVTKIPYPVLSKEGNQGTEFVDVGLVTTLIPKINQGDPNAVELKVNFQFNSFQGMINGRPKTQNKNITTVLVINSGESAAIGGLFGNALIMGFNRNPASGTTDPIVN
ncbi:MAG: hypothetical protein A3F16_02580, partial [Deltaproteobacteria bacterium RIFCSPHIGHO2_12_FULL_43_9]